MIYKIISTSHDLAQINSSGHDVLSLSVSVHGCACSFDLCVTGAAARCGLVAGRALSPNASRAPLRLL